MGLLLQKLELEQQLERRDAYIANLEIAAAKNASLPEPRLEWVKIGDLDSLPPYEKPVLIKWKGVVQHITYTLDSFEDSYWFEPHHFNEDGLKMMVSGDIEWMPLPPSEGE
jgi:hypothetical protein